MNKKAISLILLTLVSISLVGCGGEKDPLSELSKKELIELANTQTALIDENSNRISELEDLLQGVGLEEVTTAGISIMEDGTDRVTFNSLDGKIKFPTPFEYPGSTQTSSTSSIDVTTTLKIVPTINWSAKISGTTVTLEHNTGISGTIKSGYIEELYDRQLLQEEVMSAFFKDFPPATVKYSKLFLNDQWWGVDGQTPTRIDGEDAYLRAGMLGFGEQSFVYVFVYKGAEDQAKSEAILSLLRTMTLSGQPLSIE